MVVVSILELTPYEAINSELKKKKKEKQWFSVMTIPPSLYLTFTWILLPSFCGDSVLAKCHGRLYDSTGMD
jgi:hypothetical protein